VNIRRGRFLPSFPQAHASQFHMLDSSPHRPWKIKPPPLPPPFVENQIEVRFLRLLPRFRRRWLPLRMFVVICEIEGSSPPPSAVRLLPTRSWSRMHDIVSLFLSLSFSLRSIQIEIIPFFPPDEDFPVFLVVSGKEKKFLLRLAGTSTDSFSKPDRKCTINFVFLAVMVLELHLFFSSPPPLVRKQSPHPPSSLLLLYQCHF